MSSSGWKAGTGILAAVIGIVWSSGLHFWLALTDSEYAKHDESLYATFQYFGHGGWIPMILIVSGFIIYCIYKDR